MENPTSKALVATAFLVALAAVDLVANGGGLPQGDAILVAAGALPVLLFGLLVLVPQAP